MNWPLFIFVSFHFFSVFCARIYTLFRKKQQQKKKMTRFCWSTWKERRRRWKARLFVQGLHDRCGPYFWVTFYFSTQTIIQKQKLYRRKPTFCTYNEQKKKLSTNNFSNRTKDGMVLRAANSIRSSVRHFEYTTHKWDIFTESVRSRSRTHRVK